MTSAAKLQKDKLYGSTPRLAPRGTAASVARAARNASIRNSTPTPQKSPSRNKSAKSKPVAKNDHLHSESAVHDKIRKISSAIDVTKVSSLEHVPFEEQLQQTTALDGAELVEACLNDAMALDREKQLNCISKETVEVLDNSNQTTESINDNGKKSQPVEPDVNLVTACEKVEMQPSSNISRPQTPKSGISNISKPSRPQSRPVTPVKPTTRPTAKTSRPNTPRISSLPRPKTLSPSKLNPNTQTPANSYQSTKLNVCKDDITVVFSTKRREFHDMKRELDLRQKAVLETYNALKSLQDRMVKEGKAGEGEGLNQQELVFFNVADWAAEEVAQLCHSYNHASEGAGELINTFSAIDEDFLTNWDAKVLNIPSNFANLCIQAFTTRQEVIEWVKEIVENQDAINDDDLCRINRYNEQSVELCEFLHELKTLADESLHGVSQLLKQTCQERSILITVGESLVKELAKLRNDITSYSTAASGMNAVNATDSKMAKELEDTRRELEEERTNKASIKEKLSTTESQLRQARIRVTKMDRQLREAEASIASLTGTVKSLEDQSRQKEVQLEVRARKLKESLKTGEMANHHIIQERDALQKELTLLKEKLERNVKENKSTIQDLNNQLRDLKSSLETERNKKIEEIKTKDMFQESYTESLNTIEELKAQIVKLEQYKKNADLPTEKEVELRAELIAANETLRVTEEEMIACKREKVRFLETLTKIADTDNKAGMHQKLTAELINKEEILSKMQIQLRELTKSIKLHEQKAIQYEQFVRDIQMHNQAAGNCQGNCDDVTFQDLQQEIMHLRMGLLEAGHRNEELTELLLQKDQEMEQQNKSTRAQAKVLKVREELINMLKNKETEQSRELSMLQQDLANRMKIVEEVNKQIAAKADEIQDLFLTLENKQQQIHRLEKIVLALEEQQRRSQAQRTRHEEKIAALERELAGNRRERKFLFF